MTRRTLALLTLAGLLSLPFISAWAQRNNNLKRARPDGSARPPRNVKSSSNPEGLQAAGPGATANANQNTNGGPARPDQPPPPAEDRFKVLEDGLNNVGTRLDALGTKVDGLGTAEPLPNYERWGMLAGLALSLAGLSVLIYLTSKTNRRLKRIKVHLDLPGGRNAADTQPSDTSMEGLKSSFRQVVDDQKKELLAEFRELRQAVDGLSTKSEGEAHAPSVAAATDAAQSDGQRAGVSTQLAYPASVDDCIDQLRKAQVRLVPVNPDLSRFGNLSQDEDNKFWLAEEDGNPEYLLFPKARRFGSGDEFDTFYANYYECAEPSAGDVSILSPGVVVEDETKGGWRLKRKGLLKVV